ncbi:MAG: hypothetical protein SFX74_07860, partial [Fimbriimonadaceae bacterium]|nr:hypothetical protein [Fimbriimonadaceae bacterium]
IPLYGLVTSLNVATAAAIALHDAVSSLRFAHDFQPVRNSSRRLLGIAPADYSEFRLPPEGEASLE